MSWITVAAGWIVANWKTVAGAVLGVLLSLNAAYGWLNAGTVALVLSIASTLGIVVVHATAAAAQSLAATAIQQTDTAHDRIDGVVSSLVDSLPHDIVPGPWVHNGESPHDAA